MKTESVWYSARHDHIFIRVFRDKAELGCQAVVDGVPDVLSLFIFKIDLNIWNEHKRKGWLIRLGEL